MLHIMSIPSLDKFLFDSNKSFYVVVADTIMMGFQYAHRFVSTIMLKLYREKKSNIFHH